MKYPRALFLFLFFFAVVPVFSQKAKPVYHPCFLMDSVEARLLFIQQNSSRIFSDTVDCKQELLDKITAQYVKSKDKKYLDALTIIRQNPNAKVEELYTDLISRMIENDFGNFINELYMAKGKYIALEKELIVSLNMIVGAKPPKQKYLPLLSIEISKARDKGDVSKAVYMEKLKVKIESDK